jgi:DNA primase
MARIDFRLLRRQIGIGAVLDLLGFVPARRRGRQVRGPCPVHGRHGPRSRSFSTHLEKNVYRCFHCGSQGNQLDLCAAATRRPFPQAAVALCERLHHPVPRLPTTRPGAKRASGS